MQFFRASAGAALVMASTPALADHPIAGGGVSQSGPIVTIPADTLPGGALVGGIELSFARPNAYSDAELIALAAQHVHAHTTDYNLSAAASLAYGVTGHLTMVANLPFILRKDLRAGHHSHAGGGASHTVEELGSVSGIGDMSLSGQYEFAHSHDQGWGVSLLAGVKVPTGSTQVIGPSGERLETEHQPGTGSWDPLVGLAASKSWDKWALHGNALYQLSTKGAQDTQLGDRLNLSTALAYELSGGEEHHGDGHDHQPQPKWAVMIEASREWEGRQKIGAAVQQDSGSEVLWLSPGIRYTSPKAWSGALSVGLPLWQEVGRSHPENSIRIIAQVGAAF